MLLMFNSTCYHLVKFTNNFCFYTRFFKASWLWILEVYVRRWTSKSRIAQSWTEERHEQWQILPYRCLGAIITPALFCYRCAGKLSQSWTEAGDEDDIWKQLKLSGFMSPSSPEGGQEDECHQSSLLQHPDHHLPRSVYYR